MNNQVIIEYIYNSLMRIKAPSTLITISAIIIATCWYIINPAGESYIRTLGSNLEFQIPSFNECKITFRNPIIINYSSIEIFDSKEMLTNKTSSYKTAPISSIPQNKETNNITINNTYYINSKPGTNNNIYLITIVSTISLNFEIKEVLIDGKQIKISNFLENNIKSGANYVRFRYIKNDLSDIIFSLNDLVSNWIITIMFFSIITLAGKLLLMEIRTYFYSEKLFKKYIFNLLKEKKIDTEQKRQDSFDKYTACWAKWDTWFRYLQAIGPALGFLLTVSSLIHALHPKVGLSNDINDFLTGIHIAMISTFLGLLLRIIALEGNRVNDILLVRVDFLLNVSELEEGSLNNDDKSLQI